MRTYNELSTDDNELCAHIFCVFFIMTGVFNTNSINRENEQSSVVCISMRYKALNSSV